MKNFALSFSFSLFALFSFSGGCSVGANHTIFETEEGVFARLTASVDRHCYPCTADGGKWYKLKGSVYVPINKSAINQWDVSEPGIYKLELCGTSAITKINEGSVYKKDNSPDKSVVTQFSVYPNPSIKEEIRLLIPSSPISLEANTFKLEFYNTLGNTILTESNLPFGIHSMVLDMQGKGAGIYLLKITSGEEVKVLKVLVR